MMDPNRWHKINVPTNIAASGVNHGQTVLAMIRSLESEHDENQFDTILGDAMEILKSLITSCCRKGLLQNDAQKAEVVLSSSSAGRDGGTEGIGHDSATLKKKRGRNNKRDNQQKGTSTTTTTSTTDESLILSAVIRILSGLQLQPKLLPAARMSADYSTAISEHIKSKRRPGKQQQQQQLPRISLAEYELLSSSGVPLLKALWKACSQTLSSIVELERINQQQNGDVSYNRPLFDTDLTSHEEEISMLHSCLRAAASLVGLFGTKLSRSSGLISDWQKIGLSCLTLPSHDAQIAASKLLAALPLTGALYDKKLASKKTIGEQWSDFLMDAVICLSQVLKSMAPIATTPSTTKQALDSVSDSWQVSKDFGAFLDNVNSSFRDTMPREEQRASSFRFLIHGLFRLIQSVMKRDSSGNDAMLLDARVSVEAVLNLLEYMLAFSYASETLYFGTKKRLRLEAADGGVLSPASIVAEVASYVQLLGHHLFDTVVSTVGHPPLLPHSKRILRFVSRALLTSASSAVQIVVDPSAGPSTTQWEGGKGKRWLHTSISLRSQAVRNCGVTIALFGLDPIRNKSLSEASSSWLAPIKTSGAEDCISVVGGCLLEQLWVDEKESRDWGTFEERVALAENAVRSLELILLSCGGFMPISLRVLIESIVAAGLDAITIQEKSPIASSTTVKVAILRLGSACVSTPWPSGASSSVREKLFDASLKCRMHDHETTSAALSALRICEASCTARAPALYVDKKVYDFSGSIEPVSASIFVTSIQQGNLELNSRKEEAKTKMRAKDEKEEGQGKRRKIADAKEGDGLSIQQEKGSMSRGEKDENVSSVKRDAIGHQRASFPSAGEKDAERQETKPSEEEGGEEEEDVLPDILEDGGPDEEDS